MNEHTDSIKAARAHQLAEREKVRQVTGLDVTDEPIAVPYTILCPTCLFPATGENEGRALRTLAHHIVNGHARRVMH